MSQAQSVAIPKRMPLVQNLNSRDGLFTRDARLVNAYAEKDVTTGNWEINKRPGIGPVQYTPTEGIGQGLFTWRLIIPTGSGGSFGFQYYNLWVANQILYGYFSASGTVFTLGNVAAIVGKVSFIQVPNQLTPMVMMCGTSLFGAACGYYMGMDQVIHLIGSFPTNTVPGIVYLDGTLYVMDFYGTIWNSSNFNDPTVWGGLNKIQAVSEGDYGVALAKQLTYVVAIKQWTTLFFYDAGNPIGSPLSVVPGAILNFGCLDANTLQQMDGVLFWVSMSQNQPSQVVLVANLQHSVISSPAVERMLDLSVGNTFYSLAFKRGGHKFYLITNVTKNVSMVYDIGEKLWYLWTDTNGNYFPVVSQLVDPTGLWMLQNDVTGAVNLADSDYIYPTDNGTIFPVDIYTPNFDDGVDRIKALGQMGFKADKGAGSLEVRVSDDDYQTYSNFRSVNLNNNRPVLQDCGSFYRRSWHLRHQKATALRIRAVDLQLDIGTL